MKITKILIILIAALFVVKNSFAQAPDKYIMGKLDASNNSQLTGHLNAFYLPMEVDSLCVDFYDNNTGILLSKAHFAAPKLYNGNYYFYNGEYNYLIGSTYTNGDDMIYIEFNYPLPNEVKNHNIKLETYLILRNSNQSKSINKSNVLTFYFDLTTGINSTTATVKTFDVNAYVNQSNKELTLNITNPTNVLSISIINQLGQVLNVWDEKTINTQLVKQIDVSNYKAGIYYIQVSNGQNSTVKKIIL